MKCHKEIEIEFLYSVDILFSKAKSEWKGIGLSLAGSNDVKCMFFKDAMRRAIWYLVAQYILYFWLAILDVTIPKARSFISKMHVLTSNIRRHSFLAKWNIIPFHSVFGERVDRGIGELAKHNYLSVLKNEWLLKKTIES